MKIRSLFLFLINGERRENFSFLLMNSKKLKLLKSAIINFIARHYSNNPIKFVFYFSSISSIFAFLISGLITRGYSFYNLFIPDRTNFFMDFFNVLHSLYRGPYTNDFIYPPLPFLFYKILLRLIPYEFVERGPFTLRDIQAGQLVFLFYSMVTLLVLFALLMEIKKGIRFEKYIFMFITLFSAPFLFQFERANIILVSFLFLMFFVFFNNSKNKIIRELSLWSLAIATGIKIYPAIFGLLLLKQKRFNDALRTLFYGLMLFTLPFFFLGGLNNFNLFIENLISTSEYALNWGVGFSVNIQNMTRIVFSLFGDNSNNPVLFAKLISILVLITGIYAAFKSSGWKAVSILTLLMILVPSISFEYVLIFMLIPLIMFLDKEKKLTKVNLFYLLCFIMIFIPLPTFRVDYINRGLGFPFLPLTFAVLLQNIALAAMVLALIYQAIRRKI